MKVLYTVYGTIASFTNGHQLYPVSKMKQGDLTSQDTVLNVVQGEEVTSYVVGSEGPESVQLQDRCRERVCSCQAVHR